MFMPQCLSVQSSRAYMCDCFHLQCAISLCIITSTVQWEHFTVFNFSFISHFQKTVENYCINPFVTTVDEQRLVINCCPGDPGVLMLSDLKMKYYWTIIYLSSERCLKLAASQNSQCLKVAASQNSAWNLQHLKTVLESCSFSKQCMKAVTVKEKEQKRKSYITP